MATKPNPFAKGKAPPFGKGAKEGDKKEAKGKFPAFLKKKK